MIKMENDVILLNNRYRETNYLKKVDENKYELVLETYDYVRYGLWNPEDNKRGYSFVDPTGGPFMSVGSKLPTTDKEIDEIITEKNKVYILVK